MFQFVLALTRNTIDDFGEYLIAPTSGSLFHYEGVTEILLIDNSYFDSDSNTFDYIRCLQEIQYDKSIVCIVSKIAKHQLLCGRLSSVGVHFVEGFNNITELSYVSSEHLKIKQKPFLETHPVGFFSKLFKWLENKRIQKIRTIQEKTNLKHFNKKRNIVLKQKGKLVKVKEVSVVKQVEDNW